MERIVGEVEWYKVNLLALLNLSIGNTCRRNVSTDDNALLQNENVDVVTSAESGLDVRSGMFNVSRTMANSWTMFHDMTEHYIHEHDSMLMACSPMHGRRPLTTCPTDVILGDLRVLVPTLLVFGDAFRMSKDSMLK